MQEMRVRALSQEDPLEEEMATHSSNLARKNPTDRGAWWATVHGVAKEPETTEQLPSGSAVKNPPAMQEMRVLAREDPLDLPGEGNGYSLQYSCLGNSMDREAWWATVHGVARELDTS